MKNVNNFDKTEEYEKEIMDLIAKLRIACNRNKIPMFVSVCVKNDEHNSIYKSEMIGTASAGRKLTDDKIIKFVNVLNGFETIPKREDPLYNFEEV